MDSSDLFPTSSPDFESLGSRRFGFWHSGAVLNRWRRAWWRFLLLLRVRAFVCLTYMGRLRWPPETPETVYIGHYHSSYDVKHCIPRRLPEIWVAAKELKSSYHA